MPTVRSDSRKVAALGSRDSARIARLVAVLAGLAGVLLCALTPLLPVKQTTATIVWPQAPGQGGTVGNVTAPLVSGAPQALDASIPCKAIATLPPGGGVALSTNPANGIDAARNGLFVRAGADSVLVVFRDAVAAVAPRPAVASGKGLGNIFDLAQLDNKPEARVRIKPVYPFEMRRSGLKGEVVVGFIVDSTGEVRDPYIVRSSNPGFEEAALQAVLKWKFKPGKKGGVAVNTRVAQPLSFSLNAE